jgi:hypothetical protein
MAVMGGLFESLMDRSALLLQQGMGTEKAASSDDVGVTMG